MSTFIELVNLAGSIANDTTFRDGGINENLCKEFINEIQRRIKNMRNWHFLLKTSTTLTQFTAGTTLYTLDADCKEIFNIIDTTNDYKLLQILYDEFEAILPDTDDRGTPQYYIVTRPFLTTANPMQIRIYPNPTTNINVTVKYFKDLTDVTNEAYEMTNNIPEDKILAYGAASLIKLRNNEDDFLGRRVYEEMLRNMIRYDEDRWDMIEQFGLAGGKVVDPSHPLMWAWEV